VICETIRVGIRSAASLLVSRRYGPGFLVGVFAARGTLTVQMPRTPTLKTQKESFEQFNVEGQLYAAISSGTEYNLWSLKNPNFANFKVIDGLNYGDACADFVWDSLLKPWRDQVPKPAELHSGIAYEPGLSSIKLPGRNYSFLLENKRGLAHFLLKDDLIYVLVVMNATADDSNAQRFINSFALKFDPAKTPEELRVPQVVMNPELRPYGGVDAGMGSGMGPGRGNNPDDGSANGGPADSTAIVDYDRTFYSKDVTEKAKIISKVEPRYSESARKYSVKGTVVVRAVLSKTGEVTDIKVMRGLPHGLSFKAIEAARQIKFVPATKDGHTVSQYIQIEYNFNLY